MEMASIKAHKDSNTLIITKNSNYTKPITHRINLIAGMNSRCMEKVSIDGNLQLGKAARIMGDTKANNVILGAGSVIMGDLTVEGDLLALDNAKVTGKVSCVGGAVIRPGVGFGSLQAGGLIELQGNAPCKRVSGKVVIHDAVHKPPIKKQEEDKPRKEAKPPSKKEVPRKSQPPKARSSAHKKMGGETDEHKKKHKWFPW
jgi:hypothetical protein